MTARRTWSIASHLLVILVGLIWIAPFYISIVFAVKSPEEFTMTGIAIPLRIHWENFSNAIRQSNYFLGFRNSIIVAVAVSVLLQVVGSMAAYIIARNKSLFYTAIYIIFLAAIILPFQVIMLPLYVVLKNAHLMNTLVGLIVTLVGVSISITVFIITGYVKTIPRDIEESAFLEGCGLYRTFWIIVFPLMKPIMLTILVLNFLGAWNDFLITLIVAQKNSTRTLPLSQFFFFGQYYSAWNLAFAALLLSMLPVMIVYLVMQKYIISGLTAGSIKT